MRTLSFIPLIFNIENTKYTKNIPYIFLVMELISSIILFFISYNRQYILHIFLFVIYLSSIITIIRLKMLYDNVNLNDENTNKKIIEEKSVREYIQNTSDTTEIQRYNSSY